MSVLSRYELLGGIVAMSPRLSLENTETDLNKFTVTQVGQAGRVQVWDFPWDAVYIFVLALLSLWSRTQ